MSQPRVTTKINKKDWGALTKWCRPRGIKLTWALSKAIEQWLIKQEGLALAHPRLPANIRGAMKDAEEPCAK